MLHTWNNQVNAIPRLPPLTPARPGYSGHGIKVDPRGIYIEVYFDGYIEMKKVCTSYFRKHRHQMIDPTEQRACRMTKQMWNHIISSKYSDFLAAHWNMASPSSSSFDPGTFWRLILKQMVAAMSKYYFYYIIRVKGQGKIVQIGIFECRYVPA